MVDQNANNKGVLRSMFFVQFLFVMSVSTSWGVTLCAPLLERNGGVFRSQGPFPVELFEQYFPEFGPWSMMNLARGYPLALEALVHPDALGYLDARHPQYGVKRDFLEGLQSLVADFGPEYVLSSLAGFSRAQGVDPRTSHRFAILDLMTVTGEVVEKGTKEHPNGITRTVGYYLDKIKVEILERLPPISRTESGDDINGFTGLGIYQRSRAPDVFERYPTHHLRGFGPAFRVLALPKAVESN